MRLNAWFAARVGLVGSNVGVRNVTSVEGPTGKLSGKAPILREGGGLIARGLGLLATVRKEATFLVS